jgi:hypothetical protein
VCRQLGLRYYWAHLPARMGPGPKRGPRTLYRDHFANMFKIEQKDNTAEPKIRLGEDSAEGPLVDVTSSTGIYRQSHRPCCRPATQEDPRRISAATAKSAQEGCKLMSSLPIQDRLADRPVQPIRYEGKLKFADNNDFQVEVRSRVDDFFRRTGRRKRDCPQMYAKTAIFFACFTASYLLLVFVARTWWQALPIAILLGLVTAGIGFNVQHDGGHLAYSDHHWVNKIMAMTLDLLGGSSYHWYWKHFVFHHTYVNITGHDTDIELTPLARLTPHQKRRWFHRSQQFYMWPLCHSGT